jgi:Flp pilus assembly protein TadD
MVLAGAKLALQRKDRVTAKNLLHALVLVGHGDGYDARLMLGKIAVDEGDLATAERELGQAKQMDPDAAEPYLVLAKALMATREADALRELEHAAELEIMDPAIPKLLVEKYAAAKRWNELLAAASKSQLIDPFDVEVRSARARALLALGRGDEARREIELALACEPTDEQRAALKKLR